MGCIRDKETRELFSYIKRKHSVIKFNSPEELEGEVVIKSIRKYRSLSGNVFRYEVDIEFTGFVWGKTHYSRSIKKFEQRELSGLSKVKLYRLMRQRIMPVLKTRLSLFDIQLVRIENIAKIKWVG